DPARPDHRYWFTVGGGLADGEPVAAGAARELREETGLELSPAALGEPVWREVTSFPFDGVWYRQEQDYFLVRVDRWEVVTHGFDDVERASIDDHRWWSIADLTATTERYYPPDLPDLLGRLLDAGHPAPSAVRAAPMGPAPPAAPVVQRGGQVPAC
ncbi:MAG TPA: NUDIX domain-containing protein, partial [Micromonosporaceae bacterium]|nr:NUDIX domain-containing protein [Micromonosporaceae bacterium]